MKVCSLCSESYQDHVDFCFADGEVLAVSASAAAADASLDAPLPPSRQRSGSFPARSATPVPRKRRSLISSAPASEPVSYGEPEAIAPVAPRPEPEIKPVERVVEAPPGAVTQPIPLPSQVRTVTTPEDGDQPISSMATKPPAAERRSPAPPPPPAPAQERNVPGAWTDEPIEEEKEESKVLLFVALAAAALLLLLVFGGILVVASGVLGGEEVVAQPVPEQPAPVPVVTPDPVQAPPPVPAPVDVEEEEPTNDKPPANEETPNTPEPVAEVEQPASIGLVRVTSTPSASVALDGEMVGATPIDLKVPYGSHRLSISKAGFVPVAKTINVSSARVTVPAFALEEIPSAPEPAPVVPVPAPAEPAPVAAPAPVEPAPVAEPVPAAEPEPAAKFPVIVLGSVGNELFVNGNASGVLPARLLLAAGSYTFVEKDASGAVVHTKTVDVTQRLNVNLQQ